VKPHSSATVFIFVLPPLKSRFAFCRREGQFINGENIMIDGGRNAMGSWTE